ncbi:hypothetical protein ACOMHN_029068 [Nucella lapillus]
MKLFVAALFVVMFLASGVMGDACRDKMSDCDNEVSRISRAVSSLSDQNPFNLTAAMSQCGTLEEYFAQCQREVFSLCPSSGLIKLNLRSMKNSIRSVCDPDTLCSYEDNQCRLNRTVISEIRDIGNQRPLNLTLMMDRCSALNTMTVAPCVARLKAGCGNVTTGKNAISSLTSKFNNLCSKSAMCRTQSLKCSSGLSGLSDIGEAMRQQPPNVQLVMDTCRALNATMGLCVAKMEADCSDVASVASTLSSLKSGFNSACGKSAMCRTQSLKCSSGLSGLSDIGEAMRQQPPNVQLVMDTCRALNATVASCVSKMEADCSDVASVASTLSSLKSSFNSGCGKKPLCQMKMHACVILSRGRGHSGQSKAQQCRLQQQINRCLFMDMDEYCRDLPEIKPVINAHMSVLASMKCAQVEESNGGKRAMGGSLLILLLVVYTAGVTHPNF